MTCVFCGQLNEKIFAKSERCFVIRDRNPAAAEHLLVIPVQHICNVKTLTSKDIPLLREMEQMGRQALLDLGHPESTHVFGYHIPPVRSVDHLHLHVQALPYKNLFRQLKYHRSLNKDGSKGLSWFITSTQAIRTLQTGGKIGITPC
ncbi:hypothetical protein FRB93_001778 [Tulasnella sp. JGI-2019a]|nr:hypothetical protein FRB93_001778 [Tulasnella sp. JGI-2019a]